MTIGALTAVAETPRDISSLAGYFVIATDRVVGTFTGCEARSSIELEGGPVMCWNRGEQPETDSPMAMVLIRPVFRMPSGGYWEVPCFLLIEGYVYGVQCDRYVDRAADEESIKERWSAIPVIGGGGSAAMALSWASAVDENTTTTIPGLTLVDAREYGDARYLRRTTSRCRVVWWSR